MHVDGAGTTRRTVIGLLMLVVVAGCGLRVWYASWDLTIDRYWDERYSLDNVRPIMLERSVRPVRGYYPSPVFSLPAALLLEASDAVHRTTGAAFWRPMDGEQFTEVTYLLCRLLMTLYGTLTLVLVFLLGRHLVSDRVGLIAAAALAFSPWTIHASGYYKPDALLVMTVTLAFYASVRAIQSCAVRWYVVAGVAIALAMSAKLTGGLIAVPLTVATLTFGWRDRRRLGLLVLAGVVSAASFVLLNPYWHAYLHFIRSLKKDYAMRAGWVEDSKWAMPVRVGEMLTDDYGHGLVFGVLALVGLLFFAVSLVRRHGPWGQRLPRLMMLVFVVGYVAAYAVQTSYFKGNNFLPLLPFTAVAGAWLLDAGAQRLPVASARVRNLVIGLVVVGITVPAGARYVYRSLTPTARDAALEWLGTHLEPPVGRLAWVERWDEPEPVWEGKVPFAGGRAGLEEIESIDATTAERLRLTDGVVVRMGDEGERRAQALAGAWGSVHRFEPKAFVRRGPAMAVVVPGWQPTGDVIALDAWPCGDPAGCFSAVWPVSGDDEASSDAEPGPEAAPETISLTVWVPFEILGVADTVPEVRVGDHPATLVWTARSGRGHAFVTERLSATPGDEVRFTLPPGDYPEMAMKVGVHRWRLPG